MINPRNHKKALLLALCVASSLSVSAVQAADHCTFTSGNGHQNMSWGTESAINVQANVSAPTQIGQINGYQAGHITSVCSDVASGGSRSMWMRTNPGILTEGSVTSAQGQQTPLITTSVPGIAYTLALVSSTGITVDARSASTADWAEIDSYEKSQLDGAVWRYQVKFYQLPSFRLGSASNLALRAENVESLLLGDPATDLATRVDLSSTLGTLTAPLASPTCNTAALVAGAHTSGDSLQLGEYFLSDLKPGQTPRAVPFALNFTGCAGTTKIIAKLSSNFVSTSNPQLLANSLAGEATGVGVMIKGVDGDVTLVPNDVNSSYSESDANMPDNRQLDFNAYLVADGAQPTSGDFKNTATFNLSYE